MATAIIALGDINLDLTISVPAPPVAGEEVFVDAAVTSLGGSAANTARVLVALGREVGLLGAVGDDDGGRRALADLAAAGVATDRVEVATGPTGTNLIMVSATGERTMVGIRGANRYHRGGRGWEEGCRWLHLSGYALLEGPQREACLTALTTARSHDIPVSIDVPSGVARLLGPDLLETWAGIRCLSAGTRSIDAISGGDGPEALVAGGVGFVAVTAGSDPVTVMTPDETVTVAAPAMDAVDTTGAGDWFVAGLIAAIDGDLRPGPAAVTATALGAAATLATGTGTSELAARLEQVFQIGWAGVEPDWIAATRRLLGI
jgi:ribokinase